MQAGLGELLRASAVVQSQIRERTQSNLEFLRKMTQPLHVEGGWCATLQVPRTRTEEEWILSILERRDVIVQPGFFYDFESEAFLVLSLLTPREIFEKGLTRVIEEIG